MTRDPTPFAPVPVPPAPFTPAPVPSAASPEQDSGAPFTLSDNSRPAPPASATPPAGGAEKGANSAPQWLRAAPWLVLLVALAPTWNTWTYGFVDYDDLVLIRDAPLLRPFTTGAWTLGDMAALFRPSADKSLPEYIPLRHLSFAVDMAWMGAASPEGTVVPQAMRPQQAAWYVLCALLMWEWLRRMLREVVPAAALWARPQSPHAAEALALLATVGWALHPVHVESLTWLSGRKDLISGAFMLATLILAWDVDPRRPRWGRLGAVYVCAWLALLAKPMAVALVPWLIGQWILRAALRAPAGGGQGSSSLMGSPPSSTEMGMASGSLNDKPPPKVASIEIPWLRIALLSIPPALLAVVAVWPLLTLVIQRDELAIPRELQPLYLRLGPQLAAFLTMTFYPVGLVPVDPTEGRVPETLASFSGMAGLLLALSAVGALGWAWWRRAWVALWLAGLFLFPLAPVLAMPPFGHYWAGRYLFHAVIIGPLLLTWTALILAQWKPGLRRVAGMALLAVFTLWGLGTWQYNFTFSSSRAFWVAVHDTFPDHAPFAFQCARAVWAEAPPIPPTSAPTEAHLASLRDAQARAQSCIRSIEARARPREVDLLIHCTALHARIGMAAGDSLVPYEAALRKLLPYDAENSAHRTLTLLLARVGRLPEALALFGGRLGPTMMGVDPLDLAHLLRLRLDAGDAAGAIDDLRRWLIAQPQAPLPIVAVELLVTRHPDRDFAGRLRHSRHLRQARELATTLGWKTPQRLDSPLPAP